MTKRLVTFVILSSLILGALGGWIFSRYIVPKLNTINWLVRYNLAPQNSPLVINTREEIRVNEGSDSVAAIQTAKPWIVGILSGNDALTARVKSTGLIVTSDGIIATTKNAAPSENEKLFIAFNDGTIAEAAVAALDPASDLILIKAQKNNLATASLGEPRSLQLGQRIISLQASIGQYQAEDIVSFLSSETRNIPYDRILSSDVINKTFKVDELKNVSDGSVLVSLDGNAQGIYSADRVITADTIKSALNSYFKNGSIQRNYLGIYYQNVSKVAATLYQTTEGVFIKRPDPRTPAILAGSPAQTAGLSEGDLIFAVDDTQITFDNSFEELVNRRNPGDQVKISFMHGAEKKTVTVTLGKK